MKPFDSAEVLDAFIALVRKRNEHITSEYRRCVNGSSAGLEHSQPQIAPSSPTDSSTQPTGTRPSVLHTEDHWWTYQDADEKWIRHCADLTDPKSWK